MPSKIALLVETGDQVSNNQKGVLLNLAFLLEQDRNLETAYLCHDTVLQVFKLDGEGNHFCGYRNMQMVLSALEPARILTGDSTALQPWTIPRLQEAIEDAWSKGLNSHGRAQTGGILNTRKHVGTSEVLCTCCEDESVADILTLARPKLSC